MKLATSLSAITSAKPYSLSDIPAVLGALSTYLKKDNAKLAASLTELQDKWSVFEASLATIAEQPLEHSIAELEAIKDTTETAANALIEQAESLSENKKKPSLASISTDILTACTFQDIASQHASNVSSQLSAVRNQLNDLSHMLKEVQPLHVIRIDEPTGDDKLKNGPQLQKDAPSQDDIDKLFNQS